MTDTRDDDVVPAGGRSDLARPALVVDEDGTVREINPAAARLLGVAPEQIVGMQLGAAFVEQVLARRADPTLRRVNRALKALSACNAALMRASDEAELLDQICRLIIDVGGYLMAWVGYAEQDAQKRVRPVACAGHHDGYLDHIRVSWADDRYGRGPVGAAIRLTRPAIFQDVRSNGDFAPWRAQALARGYAAVIALPLLCEGQAFGSLAIYAAEPHAFDAEEVKLLTDLAANLSYGITALRLRKEQERAEAEVRQTREFLDLVIENIPHMIFVKDAKDLRFLSINRAGEELLGYPREQIIDHGEHDFLPADEAEACLARDQEALLRRQALDIPEHWLTTRDKGVRQLHTKKIPILDDQGEVRYLLGISEDVTEHKKSEARLFFMTNYDDLTGLPNRTLFRDRLGHAIAKAQHEGDFIGLLFLDLDQFKTINDTLGHAMGDQLLRTVAKRLQACMREGDTLARLGGDEFAIVLEGVRHEEDAAVVANKVLETVSQPIRLNGHEVVTTSSIGITIYPNDGGDIETLLKNADSAMYRAKETGRSNYQFFTSDLNVRALERLFLESNLRRAEERGELQLFYQPQICLRSGKVVGAEALLRWNHPELGFLTPDKFIPLAEETRLIVPMGEWVLRTACAQRHDWLERGLPALRMGVNISARQFRQPDLAGLIGQIIGETQMDPAALELELTEGALMENTESSTEALAALLEMGVNIAIDDFGTGYSSLSYLKRFPIGVVKIDRGFVRDISTDPEDAAIVEAIIAMAHSLRLKVVAEGVETAEQLAFLHRRGCDEFQGFLCAKPMPAEVFDDWLRRQPRSCFAN